MSKRIIKETSYSTREALVEAIALFQANHEDGNTEIEEILSALRETYADNPKLNENERNAIYHKFIKEHIFDAHYCDCCDNWFFGDDTTYPQYIEEKNSCIFCYFNI